MYFNLLSEMENAFAYDPIFCLTSVSVAHSPFLRIHLSPPVQKKPTLWVWSDDEVTAFFVFAVPSTRIIDTTGSEGSPLKLGRIPAQLD